MSLQTPGLDLFDGGASLKASSFNAGTLFMDALAAQDLRTFYAYCRAIDDCADEFSPRRSRPAPEALEEGAVGDGGGQGGQPCWAGTCRSSACGGRSP